MEIDTYKKQKNTYKQIKTAKWYGIFQVLYFDAYSANILSNYTK